MDLVYWGHIGSVLVLQLCTYIATRTYDMLNLEISFFLDLVSTTPSVA